MSHSTTRGRRGRDLGLDNNELKEECDIKNSFFLIKFQTIAGQWNDRVPRLFLAVLSIRHPRPNLSMSSIQSSGNDN